ncbi:MAG TPA: ROK family protein [Candidatus Saccharimonadaceae bacterium]|nr:ROK family protein [Candidatus Saccharimonadaceae bacterium]
MMHSNFALGLDIGGTSLKAARVARDGSVLEFREAPSRVTHGALAPLDTIETEARALDGARAVAVGIGCPGVVDAERGVLVGRTAHLPHWTDAPLADWLEARLGARPALDNDANLAALAEHRIGAARGARASLTVTIGTGIGCGIVLDDRPWRGARGGAGELGHVPLGPGAEPCACGVPDCVEPDASGDGLARAGAKLDPPASDARAVFARAAAGDAAAQALIARFVDRLGASIATAVHLFDPDCVVIGGGVARAGDALLAPLRSSIARYTLESHRRGLRVVPAELGERAGVVGAGLLAWDAAELSRRSARPASSPVRSAL